MVFSQDLDEVLPSYGLYLDLDLLKDSVLTGSWLDLLLDVTTVLTSALVGSLGSGHSGSLDYELKRA